MKNLKTGLTFIAFITLALISIFISCSKDARKPPVIVLKTDSGYISTDVTVAKGTNITVGIIADKTEDELKSLNVSCAYDGASSTTTKNNYTIASKENEHYTKDYTITCRNQAGTEKWIFTITDKDGNIANVGLLITTN